MNRAVGRDPREETAETRAPEAPRHKRTPAREAALNIMALVSRQGSIQHERREQGATFLVRVRRLSIEQSCNRLTGGV